MPAGKHEQLDHHRIDPRDTGLTTDQGVTVDDTDNSLAVGERGPTLMDDFHFREKLTHFDHERIPERVVHARGAGAYGRFRVHESLSDYTTAEFLCDTSAETPVFVRFSTVAGSRGSADTVRDVRGFATKFYTRQGNFDLVGNNMPVFFIQDGIKFPDFVHAVKPEPHNEIPQAASAHDTLWDFVQLQPETMHMMMWLMSDRAIPRSFRMMQGFGVHTFRLVNAEGRATFVKFHWKPRLGTHSLVWDEAQKIAGQDPDFNRRDLWDAIESDRHPKFDLCVQLVPEDDEFAFEFDLLDPTKLIPEELVPAKPIGTMVLDRNPDNFFAETEQVAFHIANVVPGIDFTNDPLLQARLFSYLDTQLIRLGGPNFPQIPINRPVAEVRNHHRDGYHQTDIHQGRATYHKNSLSGGCPAVDGDFTHYQERVEGAKIRKRSTSFADHYGQARLFWESMSAWEKEHIVAAFRFELGKVDHKHIRKGVVEHLAHVDRELADRVAEGVGVPPATLEAARPQTTVAAAAAATSGGARITTPTRSLALSQATSARDSVSSRKVAVLVAEGVEADGMRAISEALGRDGAECEVLAEHEGTIRPGHGEPVGVTRALPTVGSVLYDAVMVPDGKEGVATLEADGAAVHFVAEAFKHGKAIAAIGEGARLLDAAHIPAGAPGVVIAESESAEFARSFREAIAAHRHPGRDDHAVPA